MMAIYNLTQHEPTPAQCAAGVLNFGDRDKLKRLLTVDARSFLSLEEGAGKDFLAFRTTEIITDYCRPLVMKSAGYILRSGGYEIDDITAYEMLRPEVSGSTIGFMVGGFAPLMDYLVPEIYKLGATPLYALTERATKETVKDGKVVKISTFEHLGFIIARDTR